MKSERYFYHSFPRPRGNGTDDIDKGLNILESIRDFGLVLTPEPTRWEYQHASGSQPRVQWLAQRRVCFTELAPKELQDHAKLFGQFALEFEIDTLKALHAIPVFYIPSGQLGSSLGETLVIQLIDAMCLIDRMAKVKHFIDTTVTAGSRQNFEFGFVPQTKIFSLDIDETKRAIDGLTLGITPPEMLSNALEGVLNLFYPADASVHNNENSQLKYYRQREWRIVGNIGGLMSLPSKVLIDRLLGIDSDFYGRAFPREGVDFTNSRANPANSGKRTVDWIYVYQGIDDRHIIGAARRVVVPRNAIDRATQILSRHPKAPQIVAIEDVF